MIPYFLSSKGRASVSKAKEDIQAINAKKRLRSRDNAKLDHLKSITRRDLLEKIATVSAILGAGGFLAIYNQESKDEAKTEEDNFEGDDKDSDSLIAALDDISLSIEDAPNIETSNSLKEFLKKVTIILCKHQPSFKGALLAHGNKVSITGIKDIKAHYLNYIEQNNPRKDEYDPGSIMLDAYTARKTTDDNILISNPIFIGSGAFRSEAHLIVTLEHELQHLSYFTDNPEKNGNQILEESEVFTRSVLNLESLSFSLKDQRPKLSAQLDKLIVIEKMKRDSWVQKLK